MTSHFDKLAHVTAVLQERALADYHAVLTEERQLRQELTEIEQLRRSGWGEDDTAHARRISGVDAHWQGWLVRRQTQINQELALLQVRKAERQDAARLSFARQSVASELAANAHRSAKQMRHHKDADALRALVIVQQAGRLRCG